MQQYLDLVRHVLEHGTRKENRTGVDTVSTFGHYYEHDLQDGFPLLTTKKIVWRHIVCEMLWFLSGQTDISILKRHGCNFWDAWADPVTGKVPSAYGNFWRKFPVHEHLRWNSPNRHHFVSANAGDPVDRTEPAFNDQIAWVLSELRRNPMSRRMVVSAWAPGNAQTSKLPPCHSLFALNVQNEPILDMKSAFESVVDADVMNALDGAAGLPPTHVPSQYKQRLCLALFQRSCDIFLGVPYNIASYALLLSIFSHLSGIEPGIFGHTLVDAHVYTSKPDGSMAEYDHVSALREQLTREPRPLPRLIIDPSIKELADIERLMKPEVTTDEVMHHFRLEGYDPWPALHGKVAV